MRYQLIDDGRIMPAGFYPPFYAVTISPAGETIMTPLSYREIEDLP